MDAHDEKDDEILKPISAYWISLQDKSGTRGRDSDSVATMPKIPVITRFDIDTAKGRIARNILVGELLENPVEQILDYTDELMYWRGKRYYKDRIPLSNPDFIVFYKQRTFLIECKNWWSQLVLDWKGVDSHVLNRFHKFEKVSGHGVGDYTRIAVLAGVNTNLGTLNYLKYRKTVVIRLPAIQPRGPAQFQYEFLKESLRDILGGSEHTLYQLTE